MPVLSKILFLKEDFFYKYGITLVVQNLVRDSVISYNMVDGPSENQNM